jgi:DNA-directed RNA polymerase subunit RPC12/RpoP
MIPAEDDCMHDIVMVTYVCRACHTSFQQEKSLAPPSFLSRLFGGVKIACPKCGSKQLSEADTAPLTTKAYRKKQQQDSAPKP